MAHAHLGANPYTWRMWLLGLNPILQFLALIPILLVYYAPALVGRGVKTQEQAQSGRRWRIAVLLAFNLIFYWYMDATKMQIAGLYALGFITFFITQSMRRAEGKSRHRLAILAITVALLWLLVFKYLGAVASGLASIAAHAGHGFPHLPALLIPLGISYYTFRMISYIVEVYVEEAPEVGLAEYLAYLSFAPTLIAGPIERIAAFHEQSEAPAITAADIHEAVRRLVYGLAKKVILADLLCGFLFSLPENGHMPAWYSIVLFWLFLPRLYWDFGGYSDIAIGASRLFGYRVIENFDRPYLATNLQHFWQRWHISLSSWIRDYVYYPMVTAPFARKLGQKWVVFSLLASMAAFGVWHGARMGFLWFGLLQGAGLAVYSAFQNAQRSANGAKLSMPPAVAAPLGRLLTMGFVSVTFWLCFDPGWAIVPRHWLLQSALKMLGLGG